MYCCHGLLLLPPVDGGGGLLLLLPPGCLLLLLHQLHNQQLVLVLLLLVVLQLLLCCHRHDVLLQELVRGWLLRWCHRTGRDLVAAALTWRSGICQVEDVGWQHAGCCRPCHPSC